MSFDNIAIRVQNLSKCYLIYDRPEDRLKQSVYPRLQRLFGREPNSYGREFWALKNVSFEVKKGEPVGIIGRNGSGKSTLLQLICGTLNATTGSIEAHGRIAALLELGSGFNPEFTGRENVYMNAAILGLSKSEIEARYDDIVAFADIGEFIDQPVKTYSSGMYVRLAFAVQTAVEPDILIVDEALAVGDVAFQSKCMSRMQQIMNDGCSILFVSHDTGSVKRLCRSCIYLEKGSIRAQGAAERITDDYLFDLRELINAERIELSKHVSHNMEYDIASNLRTIPTDLFFRDPTLDERARTFRQGTGEVRLCGIQLLDERKQPVMSAKFNQLVTLRIHLEFYADMVATVDYHIRDSKNIEMIGSGIIRENKGMISGACGSKFIVEFQTRLPLIEDNYNISVVVSFPVIKNRGSKYYDFVENVYFFKVEEYEMKLWDKIYIENDCNIICVDHGD